MRATKVFKNVLGLLLTLFAFTSNNYAQNYPVTHFTMLDGLPSMTIRCVYKDSSGLLWIGTDAGLCNFNGKSFTIIKQSDGMTASQIWAIAEDKQHDLWFGAHGDGLFKYNGNEFEKFTESDGLSDNYIRTLCYSSDNNCLVVGSKEGVSIVHENSINSFSEKNANKEYVGTVTGMVEAGEFIYVTAYSHTNPLRYYPDKNKLISLNDGGTYYPAHSFSCYITSTGDTIFSYLNKGVKIYNKEGISLNDTIGQIFGIAEDKRGDIWMASWSYPTMFSKGGIFKYDGKTFKNYKNAFGINDDEIWTVFYDNQQDILWIGTINDGLYMVPFNGITNYPMSYFNSESQKINKLYLDSKDNLWILGNRELIRMNTDGSYSKLDKLLLAKSYRQFWNHRNPNEYSFPGVTRQTLLELNTEKLPEYISQSDFHFHNVLEDSDSTMIISNELGLFHYNKRNEIAEYFGMAGALGELAVLGDTLITSQAWAPTVINPGYKKRRDKVNYSIEFSPEIFTKFNEEGKPQNVNRIVKHNDKLWYVSSTSGLWMSQGMELTNFNQFDSTINKNLNAVCIDRCGHVIFGSNNGEISIATYADDTLKIEYRINSDNGLQGNSISWLVADKNDYLWAGTNQGLSCIDLTELYINGNYLIRSQDFEDGYAGRSSNSAALDRNDNLWVAANDQIIKVNTKEFLYPSFQPAQINKDLLEVNNVPANEIFQNRDKHIDTTQTQSVILKYSENNLTFHFDILNYRNPGKDRFRYKLDGFDNRWSTWSDSRKAVYTNLPSGNYSLVIEAYNKQSLAKSEALIFKFRIQHPWWGIWYLNLIGLILIFIAVILITRNWINSKREKEIQKKEIEKKIVQLEMQALQAQMNPHFIFNSINGIQSFVLANKMDEVLAFLGDFSNVVRGSLENANKQMVPLEQEIEFLNSYLRLEQMRFSNKFDFEIKTINIKSLSSTLLPPMIIQPFAENAIRHGFMKLKTIGFLSIVFEKVKNDVLKCTITDNGIGRKAAQQKDELTKDDRLHSGRITENRIQLFNPSQDPDKYKVVFTDLTKTQKVCGLMVELFLPQQNYQK